jgi:hypothetical protein
MDKKENVSLDDFDRHIAKSFLVGFVVFIASIVVLSLSAVLFGTKHYVYGSIMAIILIVGQIWIVYDIHPDYAKELSWGFKIKNFANEIWFFIKFNCTYYWRRILYRF